MTPNDKVKCAGCGAQDDLRLGFCFDCATAGEERAAKRTVVQHFATGLKHLAQWKFTNARIDFQWFWERLTRTGDYAPNGEFVRRYAQ